MKHSNSDGPGPDEFPVGSLESRAAARAMLDARDTNRRRVQLISNVNVNFALDREKSGSEARVPSADPWVECDDGTLFRMVYVPTIWERAPYSGEVPRCPACRAPYRRRD